MKVRAKEMGFYNGSRIRAGVVFELLEGHKPAKWMEVVDADAAPAVAVEPAKVRGKPGPKPKAKEPETFAELNAHKAQDDLKPWAAAKK